jgi:predicted transport protein
MDLEEEKTNESVNQRKEIMLVDIPVKDENIALNLMVQFLNLAQKRGAFSIDESAKIWECIKTFQKK